MTLSVPSAKIPLLYLRRFNGGSENSEGESAQILIDPTSPEKVTSAALMGHLILRKFPHAVSEGLP